MKLSDEEKKLEELLEAHKDDIDQEHSNFRKWLISLIS